MTVSQRQQYVTNPQTYAKPTQSVWRPPKGVAIRFNSLVIFGAGEGIRTLDPNLGKVVLYP